MAISSMQSLTHTHAGHVKTGMVKLFPGEISWHLELTLILLIRFLSSTLADHQNQHHNYNDNEDEDHQSCSHTTTNSGCRCTCIGMAVMSAYIDKRG